MTFELKLNLIIQLIYLFTSENKLIRVRDDTFNLILFINFLSAVEMHIQRKRNQK